MTTTQDNFLKTLDQVCGDVIAQEAPGVDETGSFPRRSIAALKSAGLLGAVSSPDVGGLGFGPRGAVAIIERIAEECGSTAMVAVMHYCGVAVLEASAPAEVRRAAASGDHLSTLAFSEAGSRSPFWAPTSTAEASGGDVILDARKSWVTSASQATAYVWSSRPLKAEGLSTLWLVPATAPGITVKGPFDGLGLRGNDSAPVHGVGVRVPLGSMLGEDGRGFEVMMQKVLPLFNVLNAACSVGFMEAAVRRTAAHVSGARYEHMNSAICELPTVRNYIARMRVATDSARALLDDTIASLETGRARMSCCAYSNARPRRAKRRSRCSTPRCASAAARLFAKIWASSGYSATRVRPASWRPPPTCSTTSLEKQSAE